MEQKIVLKGGNMHNREEREYLCKCYCCPEDWNYNNNDEDYYENTNNCSCNNYDEDYYERGCDNHKKHNCGNHNVNNGNMNCRCGGNDSNNHNCRRKHNNCEREENNERNCNKNRRNCCFWGLFRCR